MHKLFHGTLSLSLVLAFAALSGCDEGDISQLDNRDEIVDLQSDDSPPQSSVPNDLANPVRPTKSVTVERCSSKKACDKLKANCTGDYQDYEDTSGGKGTSGKCTTTHCATIDPTGQLDENGLPAPRVNPFDDVENLAATIDSHMCVVHDGSQIIAEVRDARLLDVVDGYSVYCPNFDAGELSHQVPSFPVDSFDGMTSRCSQWTSHVVYGVLFWTSWDCSKKPPRATSVHMCPDGTNQSCV